jgi:hypothetical protein
MRYYNINYYFDKILLPIFTLDETNSKTVSLFNYIWNSKISSWIKRIRKMHKLNNENAK